MTRWILILVRIIVAGGIIFLNSMVGPPEVPLFLVIVIRIVSVAGAALVLVMPLPLARDKH